MNLKVFNMKNEEVESIDVNDEVFNIEYNEALIHQAVVAQLANKRQGTKSTLTRSEVRGGGIKPWRQKGTGRARQGSIRAPQWIKGGVVFAPKPRDFSKKLNKKMKVLALKSALSEKIRNNEFIVVNELAIPQPKTKLVAAILNDFNATNSRTLFVYNDVAENIVLASRNIAKLESTEATLINVYDIIRCKNCIITKDAVQKLQEVFA